MYKYTIAERQETDGNRTIKVIETYNDGTKKRAALHTKRCPFSISYPYHRLTRRGVICLY